MTDGRSEQDGRGVGRRSFLAASAAAGGLFGVGRGGAQTTDSTAANAGGTPITEASVDFGTDLAVGQVTELLVEFPSPDHPVVGQRVGTRGFVLERVSTAGESAAYTEGYEWGPLHADGADIYPPLFDPVSLVEGGAPPYASLPGSDGAEEFFSEYDLVRLVGTTDADQAFYNRYDHPPFLWGVLSADDDTVEPGAVVDVAATVRYAGTGGVDGDGSAFLRIDRARRARTETTLGPDTAAGDPVTFVGVHRHDARTVTAGTTTVSYTQSGSLPDPAGGSLVLQTGTVESIETDGLQVRASLQADQQEILVGETDFGGDRSLADLSTNTVAVLDRSGSMDQTDTRSGVSRLGVAKQSARALANYLQSGNRLGVTSFSTEAETTTRIVELGEGSRTGIKSAIDGLTARGSTSIGGGLLEAVSDLRGEQGPKSIILLSDGVQNTEPTPEQVLPRLKSLGVTVYTIGMGSGADRDLLQRIADETGGEMRYRPEPGDVRELFQEFSVSTQRWATLSQSSVRLREGESATRTATVDETAGSVQFSQSYPGSTVTLTPRRPDGTPVSEGDPDVTHRVGRANEVWFVDSPTTGEWEYTIHGEQLDRPETATIQVSAESPVRADLFVTDFHYEHTGMVRLQLKLTDGDRRYTGGAATVTATNGDRTTRLALRDDGGGPDPVADDGVYTGYFHPTATGRWSFSVEFAGGEVPELNRDLSREFRVEQTVRDPLRPYLDRERSGVPTTTGRESGGGLPAGPLVGGVAAVAALGALAQRYVRD